MQYEVKSPIKGFENIIKVNFEIVDEMFATIRDSRDENTSFSLVNPYALREYSFDIPLSIKVLLEINENSKLVVYNVVVIQDPLDSSCINFLAPLVFNEDNKTVAQVVLKHSMHPDFGMAESIKSFRK
ncbi:MAG: flagellar assembly protein FliW [Campylobacterota bacterium]|nr:flagellar assembly protein FliW [Campylobacterota bacterium]